MKQALIVTCLILAGLKVLAQTEGVSINQSGSEPDSTAILDIQSSSKGILTPRMSSIQRTAINNPAKGLLVYDLDTQSFWYFDNGIWNEIRNGNTLLTYQDLTDSTFSCNQEVNDFGSFNNPREIAFEGDFAYVLSGSFTNRFDIINICNPLSPVLQGGLNLPVGIVSPAAIAVSNNYLYIGAAGNTTKTLSVYNVSDPMNPVFSSFITAAEPNNFRDFEIKGNLLIGIGGDGLLIFDITNPSNPSLISSPPSYIGTLDKLETRGDYAFCSQTTSNKLEVYDISNPSNPVHINSTLVGGNPEDMVLIESYLYVIDDDNDLLRSFNIDNPVNPLQTDSLLFSSTLNHLTAIGNKIFLRQNKNSAPILVIDASIPESPILEDTITLNSFSGSLNFETYGEYAYLCDNAADVIRVIKGCIPKSINLNPNTGEFIISDIASDDQNLSLNGYQLDIEDGNGVDLSSLFENVSILTDSDLDTKIEVEANPDEDIIRMSAGGVESLNITDEGIFSTGPSDANSTPLLEGPGSRLMWLPGISVFRVGEAVGTEWDDGNLAFNSSVLGGENNAITNSGQFSTIAGGKSNTLSSAFSFLGAGTQNNITAHRGFIGAGFQNTISGEYGFIGSGRGAIVSGHYSGVASGQSNQATGDWASVAGGNGNIAAGRYSFVGGGIGNQAHSYGETVLGTYATAYTPASDTLFNTNDQLFVIGNGTDNLNRSNAFTILKNGNVGIGTSQPQENLHVLGNVIINNLRPTSPLSIVTNTPSTLGVMTIQNQNSSGFGGAYYKDYNGVSKGYIGWINSTANNLLGSGTMQISAIGSNPALITLKGTNNAVGIGTANPQHRLDLGNTSGRKLALYQNPAGTDFYGLGISSSTLEIHASSDVADDPIMVFNSSGNVGIGITNPTKAKLEISGSINFNPNQIGYLNAAGATGSYNPGIWPYSIYASNVISGQEFHAHSDERIKHIHGRSDRKVDLNTLMQIEVTDYRLRDSISKGNRSIKKVIAQQVAEVYPQAVSSNLTEVVPDIYQRAELVNGWINLSTDLKVGERVKIITDQNTEIYEILEAETNRFKIRLPSTQQPSTVFVYGREVEDFHTVDYEAISMLNVSATQEQQKIIEDLKSQIEAFKVDKSIFEARLEALEAILINNEKVVDTKK